MEGRLAGLALAVALAAGSTRGLAAPPRTPPRLYEGELRRVDPVRIRGVRLVSLSPPRLEPTTPWVEYTGPADGAGPARSGGQYVFDAYEGSAGNKCGTPPGGGADCGLPGDTHRWYFGPGYANTYYANDMTVEPGHEGALARHADFAWYYDGLDPAFSYVIFTAEHVNSICEDPAAAGFYEGVEFDYGSMPAGGWYSNVALPTCPGVRWQMPLDGSGGYLGLMGYDDGAGNFVRATAAQPFLWGNEVGRAGTQEPVQWDDDSGCTSPDCVGTCGLPDGYFYPPCECFDYGDGDVCPDPLGAMMGFGVSEPCYADCNGDGRLTVRDFVCFRGAMPESDLCTDCNGDGRLDGADVACYRDRFLAGCD